MWLEIENVLKENRHELILHGNDISQRIESSGLDKSLFTLTSLNLLRISDTNLDIVPDEISKLVNLQSLLLHSNKIATITDKIGALEKLKILDLSGNSLKKMPESICELHNITTINLSSNQLEFFPRIKETVKLSVLDLSNNKLTEFPDVCHSELTLLSELKLKSNLITEVPSEIYLLGALKVLDLSSNKLNILPGELANCSKLKELNLKDNPIQDRRLYKLIDQCRTKQVLDYVKQHCAKKSGATGGKKGKKSKNDPDLSEKMDNCEISEQEDRNCPKLIVSKVTDEDKIPNITITEHVKKVRPFIVGCVIKNLKFDEQNFRKFIQMQTRLHENICDKRTAATIATHDLSKLKPNTTDENSNCDLLYTAKPPDELKIRPLGRGQYFSGTKLFQQLTTEADNLRKEKKRNTYSGIHKYLHLLEGCPLFPCLSDASGDVISFPPITNSETTRISLDTTDIFVEITGSISMDTTKRIMDVFLKETLLLGVTEGTPPKMSLQRVKIVDLEGNLKGVYPAKNDLNFGDDDSLQVVRE